MEGGSNEMRGRQENLRQGDIWVKIRNKESRHKEKKERKKGKGRD